MTGLAVRGLVKSFGEQAVVRGLELELGEGEIVALLGPSGCGKTTALRMVAGLERPTAGTIEIAGRRVFGGGEDLPPEARHVGMVFQSYAVWPHRSVRDNVAYPLLLKRTPKAKSRAEEVLDLVRLSGMGDRYPNTLSGGQQQRVALARALIAEPALLLFDEPLSNLDAKLREEMRHEIRQIAKQVGTTSLYVTHDQPEAFAVSDRVAVVLEGRVAQIATPSEIYHAPSNLALARFVGRLATLSGCRRTSESEVRLGELAVPVSVAPAPGGVEPSILGVRPEDISVKPPGGGGISGRVERATFLGERTELAVSTEHGELRVDVSPSLAVARGEIVSLSIARARLYPAPGGGA